MIHLEPYAPPSWAREFMSHLDYEGDIFISAWNDIVSCVFNTSKYIPRTGIFDEDGNGTFCFEEHATGGIRKAMKSWGKLHRDSINNKFMMNPLECYEIEMPPDFMIYQCFTNLKVS